MIEKLVKDFLEKKKALDLYDDLMSLLNTNMLRWEIFRQVDRENHKQDVLDEIQNMLEDENYDEPQIEITDEIIEQIVDKYEDNLSDYDNWLDCLKNAIDWVVYDV